MSRVLVVALVVGAACLVPVTVGGSRPSVPAAVASAAHPAAHAFVDVAVAPPAAEAPSAVEALAAAEAVAVTEAATGAERRATADPASRPDFPRFLRALPGQPQVDEQDLAGSNDRDGRQLVLTFDDGPDLEGTPRVLDTLDRFGVKAIFFVNGRHIAGARPESMARRELLRKVAARGHLVANHTLSHQNLCARPDLVDLEVDGNAELITAATGARPWLFRSPYGARCRRLDAALAARDLIDIGWNLDPQDWRGGSEDSVFEYVTTRLRRFRGRVVLLLHDTQKGSVGALPRILTWIGEENARAARTGELPWRLRDHRVFLPAPPQAEDAAPALRGLRAAMAGLPRR